ncbi:MAG: hypothetical protein ACE5I0_10645, partial [Candidatus Binatia bacterium]
ILPFPYRSPWHGWHNVVYILAPLASISVEPDFSSTRLVGVSCWIISEVGTGSAAHEHVTNPKVTARATI